MRVPLLEPAGPLVPGVERIAVLRANNIGDFVLALPALAALRAAYPRAEITVLGTDWHPRLLEGRPGPWDRVLVVPPVSGVPAGTLPGDSDRARRFFADRRRERYDLALQLHGGGGNSNPVVTALGARITAGARHTGAPPLDRWVPYGSFQHEVLRWLEVVGLVGAVPVELEPRLAVTTADRVEADRALAGLAGPVAVLHPGASDPRRRWPPANFAAVGDALAARGATVVLVGSGEDDERAATAISTTMREPVRSLVGGLSLSAMVGLLERAAVVVGNDSGPRHVAAAVGTATAGIYWCGNLINAGPLTRRRHRVGVSFRSRCPECGADQSQGRCPHNPSFVSDVPVQDIVSGALELYDAERNGATARRAASVQQLASAKPRP